MSSYQYHGTRDLIAMPGRSVQNYPSGLVRVERSFLCRKADVARYRNTFRVNEPMPLDNGAPAIDGLFIFPEPQEQVRDDGFVEFRVTAYGRTAEEAYITKGAALITVTLTRAIITLAIGGGVAGTATQVTNQTALGATYTIKLVVPGSISLQNLYESMPKSITPEVFGDFLGFPIRKFLILTQFSSVNFGVFSEYTYSYETSASGFIQEVVAARSV
jgi:hypothetical protein